MRGFTMYSILFVLICAGMIVVGVYFVFGILFSSSRPRGTERDETSTMRTQK